MRISGCLENNASHLEKEYGEVKELGLWRNDLLVQWFIRQLAIRPFLLTGRVWLLWRSENYLSER